MRLELTGLVIAAALAVNRRPTLTPFDNVISL
jgi:hypothetical protein